MGNNNSKQILLSILGVLVLIIAVIGVSFAAFSYTGIGSKTNSITTGTISMSYSEVTSGILLEDALPISDSQGMALSGTNNVFDFTVKADINGSGTTTINYTITALKEADSTLPDNAIKVYLTNTDNSSEAEVLEPTVVSNLTKTTGNEASLVPSGELLLASETVSSTNTNTSVTHNYRLRMWVDQDFSDLNASGSYRLRVNVYGAAAAQ